MTSAATAWDGLGAGLDRMVATYPASAPHLQWLKSTAAQVHRTADRARAAAAAHQMVLAAMVPPAEVDGNRTRCGALSATNWAGQCAPQIADADADYERMWAQNVDAMYAYAAASADACRGSGFRSPPGATVLSGSASGSWRSQASWDIVDNGQRVVAAIPAELRALSCSPLTTFATALAPVTAALSKLSSLSAPAYGAIWHLNQLNKSASLHRAAALSAMPARPRRPDPALAGDSSTVGELSVPRNWHAATTPRPGAAETRGGGPRAGSHTRS